MSIQRVFLGWDESFLRRAVAWIIERYRTDDHRCDLTDVITVIPGRRSGRRMLEVFVEATEALGLRWVPPVFVTTGELPEFLYDPEVPIPNELDGLLRRADVLRRVDRTVLEKIVPHPPGPDDINRWVGLAAELSDLSDELSAQRVREEDVLEALAEVTSSRDLDRWNTLRDLDQTYKKSLSDLGFTDRNSARHLAIESHRCRSDRDVLLIATPDIPLATCAMLTQVSDRVTAMIHCPPDHANGFDEYGCLKPDYWIRQPLDLDASQTRFVDRHRDQVYEALRVMQQDAQETEDKDDVGDVGDAGPEPRTLAGSVTIGLADESLGSAVLQTCELAGIFGNLSVGVPITQTRPMMLLAGYGRWFGEGRFDQLASLLRHPDVEDYLGRQDRLDINHARREGAGANPRATVGGNRTRGVIIWQTLLDRYIQDHLQARASRQWLGDPETASQLKLVHDTIRDLLPAKPDESRPLPDWVTPITDLLTRVYGPDEIDTRTPDGQVLTRALSTLADLLRQISQLDPADPTVPSVRPDQFINVIASLLANQTVLPEVPRVDVDILGWLELPLEEVSRLIVIGMNEGTLSQDDGSSAWLPDRAREILGLRDSQHRFARDLLSLHTILGGQKKVTLIASRRGPEDEPLLPSRLLLAGDIPDARRLIEAFYEPSSPPQPGFDLGTLLLTDPDPATRFVLPKPDPDQTLTGLAVTGFKDYLICPYRFYLKHILKLEALDDVIEMDGGTFGNLAHHVLHRFGTSRVNDSRDEKLIGDYLIRRLEEISLEWYGRDPSPAVSVQLRQLRARLSRFAQWQCQQASEGWRIVPGLVEQKMEIEIVVDGDPFTLTGKIDRIDRHESGRWRIVDYKTSDSPKTPEKNHRKGSGSAKQWIDLQLPLYRVLVAQVEGIDPEADVILGYMQLPKDLSMVNFVKAPWGQEELESAFDEACRVIREIRAGRYWPPSKPPQYDDGYGEICMDNCLGRDEAIRRTGGIRGREGGRG